MWNNFKSVYLPSLSVTYQQDAFLGAIRFNKVLGFSCFHSVVLEQEVCEFLQSYDS